MSKICNLLWSLISDNQKYQKENAIQNWVNWKWRSQKKGLTSMERLWHCCVPSSLFLVLIFFPRIIHIMWKRDVKMFFRTSLDLDSCTCKISFFVWLLSWTFEPSILEGILNDIFTLQKEYKILSIYIGITRKGRDMCNVISHHETRASSGLLSQETFLSLS